MLFAIEGIDGAGKSTTVKILDGVGFYVCATPPEKFREERKKIDKYATPSEQYSFFKKGVQAASKEIEYSLKAISPIIVDRYWITTLVYHYIKKVPVHPGHFDSIIKPDLTFFLTVSPEEQKRRVLARGMSINDQEMKDRYQELVDAYNYFFNLTGEKVEIIDTTRMLPEDVADRIRIKMLSILQQRPKPRVKKAL